MSRAGLGRLGLWLQLRRSPSGAISRPDAPEGDGPLLLLYVAADAVSASAPVVKQLRASRPDLRILQLPALRGDNKTNMRAARALMSQIRPDAILLLGYQMPTALVVTAKQNDVPVFLAEARLQNKTGTWGLRSSARRTLLRALDAIMVPDEASENMIIRMGADPGRVELTGPVAEIKDPPGCTEAERNGFAQLLSGRHAWLAADIPESEEQVVLAAHRAAMRQSHRALLFLAPRDPGRIDPLAEMLEAQGLIVSRRSLDEEPVEESHVMITDGPTEMGLWYRLAPVTYAGGTLSGCDTADFHPFEPAALGSAIVHGPNVTQNITQWQQLDGANAARVVANAGELAATMAEFTQPDVIAHIAGNAWTVSTGGAEVTQRIAAPVLAALSKDRA